MTTDHDLAADLFVAAFDDALRCDAFNRRTGERCTTPADTLAACPTGAGPLMAICPGHLAAFSGQTRTPGCCVGCRHSAPLAEILTQHWTLTPVGGTA